MTRVLRGFSIGVLSLLLTSTAAFAQATAELSGRVTDESGAVLPGVTVTATQTDIGTTRTVVTDGNGQWVMTNLPTGPYRLEVALQGFRTYVQTGLQLQVGATPTINAQLGLGSLQETVSVEAAAPIVDVRSAGISDVVQNVHELPLQGRQVTDLIVLSGAAVQTGTADSRSMTGGVSISVAGGLSFGVAYLLDGAMHNNPQNNANLPLPFPDALQEFSVATSGLTAQNGIHSGASVNAVTRSGTNAYHGNVFEFLRDRRFNATDPFARIGPDGKRVDDGLNRNQYGGTLGGPILRDRLFFFGGYQNTRTRQRPSANITYVPTAAMLAGDFTQFASVACQGRNVTLNAPFVGNRVNPALFSPAALNLARRLPSTTNPCGEITYTTSDNRDEDQEVGRVDFQWSQNHSIFGRYMRTKHLKPSPFAENPDNVLTVGTPGLDNLAQSAAAGSTMVLSNTTVNSLRFAFNRTAIDRSSPPWFAPRDLGSNVFSYQPGEMVMAVSGAFSISAGTATTGKFNTNTYQVSDDFSVVKGNHQLSVGGNIAYWKMDFLTHARSGGDWQVNGNVTGLGLSDFVLGRVSRLEHGGPAQMPMHMWYVGFYGQDTWRMNTRMTLNAGLRWEPFLGQQLENGQVYNFSMDNFRRNVKSTVFVNAPAGFIYPGDPGFPDGNTGLKKQWLNVSPRVGVAWDMTGDGRMALRSSYGISYDFPTAERHNINTQSPPWGNRSLIENPPGGFDNPYGHLGGDPHPIVPFREVNFIPFGAFGATDPGINSPRVQQWNVTLERQIGSDWGVSAAYLGSYTDRLWMQIQLNPGLFFGTGACTINGVTMANCGTTASVNQRRRLTVSGENPASAALIGNLDLHTSIGTQDYRGLRLAFRRRSTAGISLSGNYTISRCWGDNTTGGFPQLAQGPTNPDNPDADRGHCDQDRTHISNFTVGYQTPDVGNAVARAIVSGWRASGIFNARSGSWLSVTTGSDRALNGQRFQEQRVNQVSDDVYGSKTLNAYLNRAAFAQPALGTFGNLVRNSIKGPAFWTIDLSLAKLINFGTAQNIELRVETFNLLNHFNWGNPGTNLAAGTFGRIQTQAGTPRIMQFGVKYEF
ncbi:MAG: TonB-dependent receptor [Acidimicrobiia bacterium]|nr:TonB-dependent receptor [Acidimicrobiia bacterium]